MSDNAVPCPLERVNRHFKAPAPNMPWLSDFTYVATWQGFVYVAFVIDAFARRIDGGGQAGCPCCFVLDALDQALMIGGPPIAVGLSITLIAASKADSTGRRNTLDHI